MDKVYCYICTRICTKAYDEKKLSAFSIESACITNGYTNWKDAIKNFYQHEIFKCHADAVSVLKMKTLHTVLYNMYNIINTVILSRIL